MAARARAGSTADHEDNLRDREVFRHQLPPWRPRLGSRIRTLWVSVGLKRGRLAFQIGASARKGTSARERPRVGLLYQK
jgi:hypothetical protein